jgi:4-amino-4-deoxy-L-arabinose transferase-like glycosyltransferase
MTRFYVPVLLILSTLLVFLAYQRPVSYLVEIGGADAPYVQGFYPREGTQNLNWRWSSQSSKIVFHNAGQIIPDGTLRLRLAGYRPDPLPLPHVALQVNDNPLADFVAPREFVVKEYEMNPARAGDGDWTILISSDTFQPPQDNRQLGVQFDWAEIETGPSPQLPPLRSSIFIIFSTLAIFFVARARLADRRAFVIALIAAAITAAGLAFAREVLVFILPFFAGALLMFLLGLLVHRAGGIRPISLRLAVAPRAQVATVGGLALAILGQCLGWSGESKAIGVILLLAGVGVMSLVIAPSFGLVGRPRVSAARFELILIGLITGLAFFLRLYRLSEIPFAIFRDDARHAMTALRILNDPSFRPLFLGPPINQPIPYFVAIAASFKVFGPTIFGLRFVSAAAGALVPPLLWLLVRELLDWRVALLAAFGLAISSWHIAISRFPVNYVEPTLFALPAYWLLWRGMKNGRLLNFALAGLLIALAQYTAQTSKALFVVVGLLAVDWAWSRLHGRDAAGLRVLLKGLALAGVVGALALLPLASFVLGDPQAFLARPDEVSLWNEANITGEYLPAEFASNIVKYATSFNFQGDPSGWNSLPGAPFLDPVFGVSFLVGIVGTLTNVKRAEYRFVLIWLVGSLVPGLLTVEAPSTTRAIEAAAPAFAIAGLGVVAIANQVSSLSGRAWRRALPLVAGALLLLALGWNFAFYFAVMYNSPSVWRKYAPIGTHLGETLDTLYPVGNLGSRPIVYVPSKLLDDVDDNPVLQFMGRGRYTLQPFDKGYAPQVTLGTTTFFVIPNYLAYARLIAGGQTTRATETAAADERAWRAQLAPWLSNAQEIDGANFPDSTAPTFWLYLVKPE